MTPHISVKNSRLPDAPGVYFYYDAAGKLLYIGKATSLARRVGSYFRDYRPSTPPPLFPELACPPKFQRRRVEGKRWLRSGDNPRIADLVLQIARIDYIETPTVIEALVLEANQIKAHRPPFNILLRDDKSFLYLTITNEKYPRPILIRGLELERLGIDPFKKLPPVIPSNSPLKRGRTRQKFLAVYGPYTSGTSLRKALDLVRKFIPWSDCLPPSLPEPVPPLDPAMAGPKAVIEGRAPRPHSAKASWDRQARGIRRPRPCFNVHLGKCPGVCSGAISSEDYRKIIRKLMLFFDGKKGQLIRHMKKEMTVAAKAERFEEAVKLRNNLYALEHIRDVALISREDVELPFTKTKTEGMIDLEGRIEAYDISNLPAGKAGISGTSAVGSMVVFEEGRPAKAEYRRFRIKTVRGANDVAMLEEVMRRRLRRFSPLGKGGLKGGGSRGWKLPELMIIDGGEGQVNRVKKVLAERALKAVRVIGIAKGFDRKQDRLVYDRNDVELARVALRGKELFQRARDEAHRFAITYHRKLRSKSSLRGG